MTQQPRRKRGVGLILQGKQKLLGAIRESERERNLGEKYTIKELSGKTRLDPGTVAKVLDAEEGADRRTFDRFFRTFNLELTEADYRRPPAAQVTESGEQEYTETHLPSEAVAQNRVDLGEAVDVSIFYARIEELVTLKQWIVDDRRRLVALLGMGGIGKTSLAARLVKQIQRELEYVVWRSLKDAPPLNDILTSLIQFVSNQGETEADLLESIKAYIPRLLEYLRNHRCLLILAMPNRFFRKGKQEFIGKAMRAVGNF
jgi:ATP-dependent Clp protease ATP-binding subunit ClpA